ncbi:MAG: hypothetical protein IPM39_21675 [Chloroflexi bacterium]|nr:hypothetical protein [Chloroflexota bacterium]
MDGDRTISTTGAVLNRYARVVSISSNVITVADISTLNDTADDHYTNDTLAAGDLILIYQAQGATFTSTADDATYGAFEYGEAGKYEFALVTAVAGNNITVATTNTPPYTCSGITNTYNTTSGNVQMVRVPQYTNLTIESGASVTAPAWNGATGGIIALHVQYNLVVNGTIDASGLGFRGGEASDLEPWDIIFGISSFRDQVENGGEKGESILGDQTVYDGQSGRYGRGAPANGGGGGNAHNAGGGGGANGSSGSPWKEGYGFVDTNDVYADAWRLDPGTITDTVPIYFQGGAGGGRGGYSYSNQYEDPTQVFPNASDWGGDSRRQVGGLGGRALNNNPNSPDGRLFFGGGGGGGDGNNDAATSGGNGGGLVILVAHNTSGSGTVLSNGETALNTTNSFDDGAGGGGGGGAILLKTPTLSTNTLTLSANGGNGGNQPSVIYLGTPYPQEAMGPGGGGGGGYIAVASGSGSLTAAVDGGTNGISLSDAMNGGEQPQPPNTAVPPFPPNGATQGYPGGTSLAFNNAGAITFPGCGAPTAVSLQTFSAASSSSLSLVGITGLLLTAVLLTWALRRRQVVGH